MVELSQEEPGVSAQLSDKLAVKQGGKMIRSSSSCFQYPNEKLLWVGWDEKQ